MWAAREKHGRASFVLAVAGASMAALGAVQLLAAQGPHLAAGLVAAVIAGCAVAWLAVSPIVGLCVLLALDVVFQLALGDPPFVSFVATMVAVFELARSGGRRAMLVGIGATSIALAVMAWSVAARGTDAVGNVVIPVVYFAFAALAGTVVRHTARYARIARAAADALEREQVHLAELAAAAERERLARELHDVISHGVTVMVLQAEGARAVVGTDPVRAALALDAIADTGRHAIGDLHEMLGMLRPGDGSSGENPAELEALVEPIRRAGFRVDIVETGDPLPLPPAAYRVVQEALTNVLKHARATSVTVAVARTETALVLDVLDDGAGGHSGGGSGRGLIGMAERVGAAGGTLRAGPEASGFRVHAELPRLAP